MAESHPRVVLFSSNPKEGRVAGRTARRYEGLLRQERGKMGTLERELHRLKDFTEKIASNVPISIIIVDPEMRITYVNHNFCRAMGKNPNVLIGRTLVQIFPETLYGPTELVEKAEQVIRGGGPTPRFSMGYRGDPYTYRVLPIRTRTKGNLPKGEVSRQAMILIENVSEIRSLGERVKVGEEKFRTLFESSPDGLLVTRPGGGRILESNKTIGKDGATPQAEVAGRALSFRVEANSSKVPCEEHPEIFVRPPGSGDPPLLG